MKTCKVLDIDYFVRLVCIKNIGTSEKYPFWLYLIYKTIDKYLWPTQHQKMLAKYDNMESVLCHINDMFDSGIQYRPIDSILAWNKEYCSFRT